MNKQLQLILATLAIAGVLGLAGCGGGSSTNSNTQTSTPQGTSSITVSDDSTQDWATIGVKILSIAFVPQGGGTPVTVYTAPNPTPVTNLVQLDQLADLLGNLPVAAGTYTSAIVTISANPRRNARSFRRSRNGIRG